MGGTTCAADIATAIGTIVGQMESGNTRWGTYHFAGGGAVSWHGFGEAIVELAARWNSTGRGPPPRVEAITTADYPTPARRPANSVLDCTRIGEAFGIMTRQWQEALAEVIREIYAGPAKPLSRTAGG